MDERERNVPFIAHEADMARMERTIKRLWILLILLVVLLVSSNCAWLWYESQYDEITITAEQRADCQSNNYAIGGDYIVGDAENHN